MVSSTRRQFRIETYRSGGTQVQTPHSGQDDNHMLHEIRHREVLNAISSLKAGMDERLTSSSTEAAQVGENISEISAKLLGDLAETKKLQEELKNVQAAIEQTKSEILSLHREGAEGKEMSRVSDELDAIVTGTEHATESILESVEIIDQSAGQLAAAIKDESQNNMACDIQDQVVKIFEACNFQDLTGQRISKVVSAFRFVDERITSMLEIWGGIESFNDVNTAERDDRAGDKGLLNGPPLEEDQNIASQADIDALFD